MITRHFVDSTNADGSARRVHYRRAGSGPPVLLVHQSPRSSLEYLPLLEKWAGDFTLIAPDTAGFGDSAPLKHDDPELADYGAALIAFMDALGLERAGAYGFHSGASIAAAAARLAPERFSALALAGYSVWTPAEMADFAANYTPKFVPQPYGEHLAWLWGRLLEQTWFFPWYRTEDAARLPNPTDDPMRLHGAVMDVLAAGDTFRLGYAAVLRAKKDLPGPGEPTPPVLLTAYDGDPLKSHLGRLGSLPEGWEARPLATPEETEAAARDWLLKYPAPDMSHPPAPKDEGFIRIQTSHFDGIIHWKGDPRQGILDIHNPGSSVAAMHVRGIGIDLPGHGLSDDWHVTPTRIAAWIDVVTAAIYALGIDLKIVAEEPGPGVTRPLASLIATQYGASLPSELRPRNIPQWIVEYIPDLTPDRYGAYLQRAWQAVRAQVFFDPWFQPNARTAIPFDPADATPKRLAVRHRALLQARSGRLLTRHCLELFSAS